MTQEITDDKGKSPLKKAIGFAVRWLLPVALTVLLLWYMFEKVNFHDMMDIIRKGVDYWWILLAMGISVFSHIFRAMRWRIQLKALGIRPPLLALCCSIFGCYALNLVFPRLGEVWRCTYIADREKKAFATVFGSMVGDRLFDTLMVLLLTVFAFIVATPAINSFLEKYPVGRNMLGLLENPWFWALVAGGVLVIFVVFRYFRGNKIVAKIVSAVKEVWQGLIVITKMEGKWKFCFLTVAIWFCYYIQLYVAFYAFPFTRELCANPELAWGLTPCLVAFVLSSIGMAIPSNGGLGPWNIAVMFGLAVYGLSNDNGAAFSMLQWTGQTVMLVILGIFTMIYISVSGRKSPSVAKEISRETDK